jgi:hypothetical protein
MGVTSATIRNRVGPLKASGVMDLVLVINPYKSEHGGILAVCCRKTKIPGVANTESFIGLDLHEQKFKLRVID